MKKKKILVQPDENNYSCNFPVNKMYLGKCTYLANKFNSFSTAQYYSIHYLYYTLFSLNIVEICHHWLSRYLIIINSNIIFIDFFVNHLKQPLHLKY